MNKETLINGLRLYYRILKLHRKKLPPQMRRIGDVYLKTQFHQHHSNPNPQYYNKFYQEWLSYAKQLEDGGVKGVSRSMEPTVEKLLSEEQKETLKSLKTGVEKIKM